MKLRKTIQLTFNKPNPVIEKITFTEEQQQEIKTLLEGKRKPSKYTKGHYPLSSEYKMKLLKNYYGGYCHSCMV